MDFDQWLAEVIAIKNKNRFYEDTDVFSCVDLGEAKLAYISDYTPREFALDVDISPIRDFKIKQPNDRWN